MLRSVGERLRQAREELGRQRGRRLSQRELAALLRLNEDTYRSYEYDKATLPATIAKELAKLYDRAVEWFYLGSDSEVGGPMVVAPVPHTKLPFIGKVGANMEADWLDPLESEELEYVPPEMGGPGRFCCRILGDSCFDLLWPDDLAIFQKDDVPRLGLMVLYRSPDHRVTVKQLKHDGRSFVLHPLNPNYSDMPADGGVVGYLVGIVREQGTRRMTVYDPHGVRP